MNTVSVDKSLLTRVTQYVADRVFDFQQAETAPDGSIEVEAQEIIDSELKLLSELQAALPQAEQPEAGRDEYHRCGKNIRRHKVSECRPQAQDESHRICGCEECRGPTPYEAEHPSEGNVGWYYGEAAGANTWDIYRPDGSFLTHIDRPGVFYAILDELNKLNATTRPQPQEANAEAVRLLRKVWHCRTGYGTDVCEMLAEDDYDDLCAEVEAFLAQHGGRGDE